LTHLINSTILKYLPRKSIIHDNPSNTDARVLLYSGQVKVEVEALASSIDEKFIGENPNQAESSIEDGISTSSSQILLKWKAAIALYKIFKATKINELHVVRESGSSFFSSYPFMKSYFTNLHSKPLTPSD
jgi:hypothetical protein